jgi:hypothetical protein
MRTQLSVLTALVAVWLAIIGLMALAPEAAGMRFPGPETAALPEVVAAPQIFSHTGLWIAERGPEGSTVFIRDLRRQ